MQYILLCVVMLAPLTMPVVARAQSEKPRSETLDGKLDVSGSVRLRYEAIDGQPRAGLVPDEELISIRTTVLGEYTTGDVRFGAELYDSRAYFGKAGGAVSANEVNAVELVQAYVGAKFGEPFGKGSLVALQAGRYTLNLGSRRLIAADDYRNTTNGYTGIRADLRGGDGLAATLIYVLPQVRLPDDQPSLLNNRVGMDRESFDLQLWGGYVSKSKAVAGATLELGYFGLSERDGPGRPTRDRQLQTGSVRLIREPAARRADFEVEAIYQFGTVRSSASASAPRLGVSAWFIHADAGYTFPGPIKARLSLEYDYASGDRPGGRYGRFDTLFGMRRAELAPAGLYNAVGRANISTAGLRFEGSPTRQIDGFVVYRGMWLAEKTDSFSTTGVRDPTGQSGSFAGHQLEGRLRWWLVPKVLRAEVNAVWLGKGRFLVTAPNAPRNGNARYLSIALTTSF